MLSLGRPTFKKQKKNGFYSIQFPWDLIIQWDLSHMNWLIVFNWMSSNNHCRREIENVWTHYIFVLIEMTNIFWRKFNRGRVRRPKPVEPIKKNHALCILLVKILFWPFSTFFVHFKHFSVIFQLKSRKNVYLHISKYM